MEQGLGVTVQRLDLVVCVIALLGVIKANKEGRLLYGIQRLLVFTIFEELLTGLCPRGSEGKRKKKESRKASVLNWNTRMWKQGFTCTNKNRKLCMFLITRCGKKNTSLHGYSNTHLHPIISLVILKPHIRQVIPLYCIALLHITMRTK